MLKSAEDLALLADVDTLNATISQLVSALEAFELGNLKVKPGNLYMLLMLCCGDVGGLIPLIVIAAVGNALLACIFHYVVCL